MFFVLLFFILPNVVFSCCSSADDVATSTPLYEVTILCPQGNDGSTTDCVVKRKESVDIQTVKEQVIEYFKLNHLKVKDFSFYGFNTDLYYYEDCTLPPNCTYAIFLAFDMLTVYCAERERKVRRPFSIIMPEISSNLSRFTLDDNGILCVESAKIPESPIKLVANQARDTISDIAEVAFDHSTMIPQTVNFQVYEKMPADMIRVYVVMQDKCKMVMMPEETTVLQVLQYITIHFYESLTATLSICLLRRDQTEMKETARFHGEHTVSVSTRAGNPLNPNC